MKERVRVAVRELARRRPEIERAVLFGSLAKGQAVPGSDADLLLVLRECGLPFLERIARYRPEGCGIGVDVFPYTRAEIDKKIVEGDVFVRRALGEGVDLL